MIGDGTEDGTQLRIVDPWPVGKGERYRLTVRQLAASHAEASRLAGSRASMLYADGGRGARRVVREATSAASYRWSER
jgi:hypothetical protein